MAVALALAASVVTASTAAAPPPAAPQVPSFVSPWDWPTYGHDAQHTFDGRTTLTEASARALKTAWYFPTVDAVTATPTVVSGTVYVGSWDDYFYALDLETGKLRWKVRLKSQNAITPYPGQSPRDTTSDGGLVTSSAWFEPAAPGRPALVIFGGGYTLYALKAANGAVYWEHDYPGVPGPPDPNIDGSRIFSSPVVVGDRVLFGVDEDGQRPASAGYVVAASLKTGDPLWTFQTDIGPGGRVLDDSCGSVWSSGTVLTDLGLVVFGTADCDFAGNAQYADSVIALRIRNGQLAWQYHSTDTLRCDEDFGATPNAGVTATGRTVFLGEGSKDGSYYSFDPRTGTLRWKTNVVFGGSSGGFIGTTAYDGQRVYGATGLGDFHPSSGGNNVCDPSDPADTAIQNPTDHAFVAQTGAIAWQQNDAASFAPTTIAGGMMFNGPALANAVQVRDATTGQLIAQVPLPQANWSGIATVGDALVLGVGSSFNPAQSGVVVLTPRGTRPLVPGEELLRPEGPSARFGEGDGA